MEKVCIIGAGLAGGLVSKWLDKNKYEVTVVEQAKEPEPYDAIDEVWDNAKPKAVFTRGKGIGGTTNYWHSGLTVLDESDIEFHSDLFGEKKLPISYQELKKYYTKAISFLTNNKVKDLNAILNANLSGISINTENFMYKGVLYPETEFCTKGIIEKLSADKKIKLLSSTKLDRLVFDDGGNKVEYALVLDKDGNEKKLSADIFVLCAGGLGSPKILLSSVEKNNILYDLPIGKFLLDHPSGFVFKARLKKRTNLSDLFGKNIDDNRLQYGFVRNSNTITKNDLNHILYLRPALSMKDPAVYDFLKRRLVGYKGKKLRIRDYIYLLRHIDLLFEAINFRFGLFNSTKIVSGLVFIEQFPSKDNKIHKNQDGSYTITWGISDAECDSLDIFLRDYFRVHKEQFENYKIFKDYKSRLDTASHHSGGCRMTGNSKNGVVDKQFKVFGSDNLFIVDGSILGYSGYANTGLTISALAILLADNLNSAA